jgi:hypothetical protein
MSLSASRSWLLVGTSAGKIYRVAFSDGTDRDVRAAVRSHSCCCVRAYPRWM